MSAAEDSEDDLWTPRRRRALDAVADHLAPPPGDGAVEVDPLGPRLVTALTESRFAGQDIFVVAILDELTTDAGGPVEALSADALETLLRSVETKGDPYLGHGLRLLLGLCLEARYAARTTRPYVGAASAPSGAPGA